MPLDEKNRKFLFDYSVKIFAEDTFSGWDWHYDILMNTVPVERWDTFVDSLIEEMADQNYYDFQNLAKLMINEKRWKKLLALLETYPTYSRIDYVAPHLSKDYYGKLAQISI